MNRLFVLPACCLVLLTAFAARVRADTVVVFNEIMYHPAADETLNEWIELRNLMAVDVDLSGWSLSGMVSYTFPSNSIIKGGQHLIVARAPAVLISLLGTTNVHGPFVGRLDNDGGNLKLRNNSGRIMDEISYDTEGDWPVAPDGSGVSLSKRNPDTASGPARNWTASEQMGGTPGARNFSTGGFVPPAGLVSWWPFNEPSGSSIGDQSGVNHGTIGSGVTRAASSLGGALSFNGTSSAFANVGSGTSLSVGSALTIEAVLQPGWSTTNTAVLFRKAPRRPLSYRDAVLTNAPLAYWRLGDASTTIADATPNARIGAATAGVLLNQPSLIPSDPTDTSMRFTGTERVTINGFEKIGPTGYTVEFWVRPQALPTGCCQNLVGDGEGASDFFMMNYILGPQQGLVGAIRPHYGPNNSPVSLTGGTALQVNNTYHIVTTWDTSVAANNGIIYINGQPSSIATISRTLPAAGTLGNNRVYIGKDDRDTTDGTEIIDEVALYNRPLTPAEVLAHYDAATITNFDITLGNAIQLAFQDDGNNAAANPPVANGPVLSFGLTVGGVYSELDMPLDGAAGRPSLAALQTGMHHVAATFDSATGVKAIYVDGTLRFSTTLAGALNGTNTALAILGNAETNGSAPFVGTLDEVAYWSRALTGSEVAAHWTSVQAGRDYFTPDPVGATARLAFNEVSASTNAGFWLELVNYGTNNIALGGFVIVRDGPEAADSEYVFPVGPSIASGAYLALTNTTLGFHPVDGDRLFLLTPARDRVLDSMVVTRGARARVPAATGPFVRPTTSTPGGANHVVFRDEIVINEILYHHAPLPPLATNLPPRESPEAWVELYNRSGNPVDLTGWEIDGGIQYRFSAGKILAPGAFLVVADDAAYMRSLYPAIDVVGDFGGKLSGSSDRIVLRDPAGNTADEVTYYDRGPWPEYADGGGSSLELCDARLDNSKPEAWADSDESGKTGWMTNSYRMVASTAGAGQPTIWADFIFGLLGPGECLIDDISVIQNPATTPVQLISNGDFSAGLSGWRVLGTHGRSVLTTDPLNPGNNVLRIIATGPQEHMHNHVERTLNNQTLPQNGVEYQISYRVKWLAGNNLLNTRLYFNRCARTIAMPMPALNGTPGAPNGNHGRTGIPTFSDFGHQPVIPQPGAPVTVSVTAQAPGGVNGVQLFRSVNGGAPVAVAMTALGGGRYSGTLPGQSAGAIVQFWVAADGAEADAEYPPGGASSGALYTVADGQANLTLAHNVRIILTPANRDLMHASTNVMSNDRLPGTIVFDESRAYYNCGVRLKGSERGRPNSARVSWHLEFPADDPFRGVHPFMLVDRSGAGDATSNKQQEMLIKHILLRAGNIPSTQPDICRVIAPNPVHTDSAMLAPRAEDELIETYFDSGGDGGMWELELIYYPNANQTNAAGYKFVQSSPNNDSVIGTDISDVGNDKEIYRYNFIIKNHRAEDDYAPFMTFAKTFSIASASLLEAQTAQVMDLDAWTRAFAMESLCGVGDSYTFGNNHNLFMYRRPVDGKFVPLPTDMDFSFNRSASATLIGDQRLSTIFNLVPYRRLFYTHVMDLIGSSYNTSYMSYWVPHYAAIAGQNYSTVLSSYMPTRISTAINEINGAGGNAAFAITSPTNILVSNNLVVITGTAPISARTIRVNGIEYPITWSSISSWSIRVPVSQAFQALSVVGYDIRGQALTNLTRTVNVTNSVAVPDPAGFVVFNEIMYNPTAPDASYLELFNTSTNITFDLSNWRINGLDFTFPPGSILPSRSFILLAKSMPAYVQAYGSGVPVPFATYAGSLENNGETLTLFRPGPSQGSEIVVDKVRYESLPPWPTRPNGLGSSLQLIDATKDNTRVANWTDGTGWRFFSFTANSGAAAATSFAIFLANAGELYVDGLSLVLGSTPDAGPNLLVNGSFEDGLNSWGVLGNHISSTVATGIAMDGTNSLRLIASGAGVATSAAVTQALAGVQVNLPHTVSFWFLPSTSTTTSLNFRVTSSLRSIIPIDVRPGIPTPGTTNSAASTLTAFPALWLNEVQPENPAGIMDNQGEREPWIEIYNSGTNVISLAGFFLSNSYSNLARWPFPPGAEIQPGQFKIVFCDGEPNETTPTEWHASFRLSPTNGSVAVSGGAQLLDYLNYAGIPTGRSYGDFPDGQTCERQEFYLATPGGTNDNTAPPLSVVINEWMADNSGTLTNTHHNNLFDDWFELHNTGNTPADLRGYFLTDNLNNPDQFEIPAGYVIPPHGFLVVWADGRPDLNTNTDPALHVNFQLNLNGESLGLFASSGAVIDSVSFEPQFNNISQGRFPDGPGTPYFLAAPTPGASNSIWLNRYPSIAPIPDDTAYVGAPFDLDIDATDPDVPPQVLSFSFVSGAPTNALLNPVTGQFSWTPVPAQSDSTNIITVRVTDNGPLNLSSTRTFTLVARTGFVLGGIMPGPAGTISFSVGTIPGKTYRVQYKNSLSDMWTDLPPDHAASSTSLIITDMIGAQPHRFYQVIQLD